MISFPVGFDHRQPVYLRDRQNAAVNLTGASGVRLRLYREPREEATVALDITTASSPSVIVVTTAASGLITVLFDGVSTTEAMIGSYSYEVTCALSGGDTPVWRGTLELTPAHITEA